MNSSSQHYDLVVIGGGSGGLAASKEAAGLGKKVAVLDYVTPSPLGSTWGLGGTCVNVGCIPKKLMHKAAIHGEDIESAKRFGWSTGDRSFDWPVLVSQVQKHIKGINDNYITDLQSKDVTYLNALGSLVDKNTIALNYGEGDARNANITADTILIAVGGRPRPLSIEGGEYALTSDDLFMKETPPGKVCVVGASYVALECAGFLTALGFDVTVLVRSILLRGFDQEMAELIKDYMSRHGTKFIDGVTPKKIVKDEATGKFTVTFGGKTGPEQTEVYDTIFNGTGRLPCTGGLGLESAGVKMTDWGEIPVDKEQTNVDNIYAIGDVIEGIWELTPVAIQAGKMLAQRLYNGSSLYMDYHTIPTTVFTPLEYGAIGYAETDGNGKRDKGALSVFGEAALEVYHTTFRPLEWSLGVMDPSEQEAWEADGTTCSCKLICLKEEQERIIGFHYAGPNAGEVTQGFATAMRLGATKMDFDMTVGIHPTTAENFTTLKVTKSSGEDAAAEGC